MMAHRVVLVVEDHAPLLHVIAEMLERFGYDARLAGTAADAYLKAPQIPPHASLASMSRDDIYRFEMATVDGSTAMGAGVDATVIAEGIETQEEADALVSLGVRWGQGYLFGRPQDPYAPNFRPGPRAAP